LEVSCPEELLLKLPGEKRTSLLEILRQDPRPSYQTDGDRIYGFLFSGFEIRFYVKNETATVVSVEKADESSLKGICDGKAAK